MISPPAYNIPRELISYILSIKSFQAWKERLFFLHSFINHSSIPVHTMLQPGWVRQLYHNRAIIIKYGITGTIYSFSVVLRTVDTDELLYQPIYGYAASFGDSDTLIYAAERDFKEFISNFDFI